MLSQVVSLSVSAQAQESEGTGGEKSLHSRNPSEGEERG